MTLRKTLAGGAAIRAQSAGADRAVRLLQPDPRRTARRRSCKDAAAAGIDGLLVVDLPPEECAVLREPALKQGLAFVPLVAPTSSDARVQLAASVADAFIYYVSLTGVTGSASADFDAGRRCAHARYVSARASRWRWALV